VSHNKNEDADIYACATSPFSRGTLQAMRVKRPTKKGDDQN